MSARPGARGVACRALKGLVFLPDYRVFRAPPEGEVYLPASRAGDDGIVGFGPGGRVRPVACAGNRARRSPALAAVGWSRDDLDDSHPAFGELFARLEARALGYLPTASLLECLVRAAIRQVIQASQARRITEQFIARFGKAAPAGNGSVRLFPDARVSGLDGAALLECGMGFKAKLVERLFELEREKGLFAEIGKLDARGIYRELVALKGIGHWTASVAVATYTGDWSHYPCDDLAVRTWASKILIKCEWPAAPDSFEARWRDSFGEHVGAATLLLLACGSFGGGRASGDSGARSGTGGRRGVRELAAEGL